MQNHVRFNRDPEKVSEKVGEALVQSQIRFFRRRFQEALVQDQVRFNRVLEKVSEKVPVLEKVGEALVQSQVRFRRFPGKVSGVSSGCLLSTLQKDKKTRCGCYGIPLKLILLWRSLDDLICASVVPFRLHP